MTRICFTDCIDGKGTDSSNSHIVSFSVLVSRHYWLFELERSGRVTCLKETPLFMRYLNPERAVFDPKMFMGFTQGFTQLYTLRSFGLHRFG